jgi:hypothetical protein
LRARHHHFEIHSLPEGLGFRFGFEFGSGLEIGSGIGMGV